MDNEIVVRLPHQLGVDVVNQRLHAMFEQVQSNYGKYVAFSDVEWTANRVTFAASTLGQTVRGAIDVAESHVELKATLPFLLRSFARRIASLVQDSGVKLLK